MGFRGRVLSGSVMCDAAGRWNVSDSSLVRQSGRTPLIPSRRVSLRRFRPQWKDGDKVMCLLPGDAQKKNPPGVFLKQGAEWKHRVKQTLASFPDSPSLLPARRARGFKKGQSAALKPASVRAFHLRLTVDGYLLNIIQWSAVARAIAALGDVLG